MTVNEALEKYERELHRYPEVCRFPVPYCTVYWTKEDWDRYIANTCICAAHASIRLTADHRSRIKAAPR
jgi:hypothetical protein